MSYPNTYIINCRSTEKLLSHLRSDQTDTDHFVHYADRVMTVLAEEGLASLPHDVETHNTPTGVEVPVYQMREACAVSIIRAGDSLLNAVRRCCPSIACGKILIQRDESTADKVPRMYYSKLPPRIADMDVLLVDPMLATGGSACMAIKTLLDAGVQEDRIVFLNVVACPEGIARLTGEHPNIQIVTLAVDESLNEEKYIMPGLGDYGDRYFNTL